MDGAHRLDWRRVENDFHPERISEQLLALAFARLVGDGRYVQTVADGVQVTSEDRNRQASVVQEVGP